MSHTYDSFEDLHTDIYNSITKTDLYKILNSRITIVVKIYKTIGFLEKISVDWIYKNYLTKIENHTREKRDNPNHEYFCQTHIGYIDNAIIQLKENIKISQELIHEIELFLK